MKIVCATIASLGLGVAVIGLLQLPALLTYVFGDKTFVSAPSLIGIGACVYLFGRTWMLATWPKKNWQPQTEHHETAISNH